MNARSFETHEREGHSHIECAVMPAVANPWRRMGDGEIVG